MIRLLSSSALVCERAPPSQGSGLAPLALL
jgi:hypothetical protein